MPDPIMQQISKEMLEEAARRLELKDRATPDEARIKQIEQRVRRTICETYSSDGKMTVEGRILKEDFEYLMASMFAWKFTSKIMSVE